MYSPEQIQEVIASLPSHLVGSLDEQGKENMAIAILDNKNNKEVVEAKVTNNSFDISTSYDEVVDTHSDILDNVKVSEVPNTVIQNDDKLRVEPPVVEPKVEKVEEPLISSSTDDTSRKDAVNAFGNAIIGDEEDSKPSKVEFTKMKGKEITELDKMLNNIDFSIDNIDVVDVHPTKQLDDIEKIFGDINKSVYEVSCLQSAYNAHMTALTMANSNSLNSSSVSVYEHRRKLYSIVYEKINSMSIPKPDFNTWTKMTSFFDLDTLIYGIYCQTYPDASEYQVTCNNCGGITNAMIGNETLVQVKDKEVYSVVQAEQVKTYDTLEKVKENSLIKLREKRILPNSKIYIELKMPSIYDQLSILKNTNASILEKYSDTVGLLTYVGKVMILDVDSTIKTGKACYYEVKEAAKVFDIMLRLSQEDGEVIEEIIDELVEKYRVYYAIQNVKCRHCNTEIPAIPVDMSEMLFFRLDKKKKQE